MKMKMMIPILCVLALSACGGGGDGGSNPTIHKKATGKVIDGYIVGATVFLDINNDGKYNANTEPRALTTKGGSYELDLNETQDKCLGYAPTIVDVPVGAIDEDLGPVKNAYRMVLPPEFKEQVDFKNRFITPLTSSLWATVETSNGKSNYTCQDLMSDIEKQTKQAQALEHALTETIRTYNISEAKIYGDFIASEDSDLALKAQNIVTGLKKSFTDTKDLQQTNPNSYVQVHYYFKDENGARNWYKKVYISSLGTNQSAKQTTTKMSDDLLTEVEVLSESTSVNLSTQWGVYNNTFDIASINNFNSSIRPGCTFTEKIIIKDDKFDNVLSNIAYDGNIHNLVNCQSLDLTNKIVSRTTSTWKYNKSIKEQLNRTYVDWNEHTFGKGDDFGLSTVVNVKSHLNSLDTENIKTNIMGRYKDYSSNELGDASKVIRSKIVNDQSKEITYWKTLFRASPTTYSRRITSSDQTSVYEKSTDGTNWVVSSKP
ncbi:hypothetical protein [Vibrio tasmaniensis]|nr:hypothetical protein [Vibrio tasmaniensis]